MVVHLFVHNTPVTIHPADKAEKNGGTNGAKSIFHPADLVARQRIYLAQLTPETAARAIATLHDMAPPYPAAVEITMLEYLQLQRELAAWFKPLEAAGGVVEKEGRLLLIHRLGKWDLPKGKRELGESLEETARREIEEECGVCAVPVAALGSVWHTFSTAHGRVLKRVVWYAMEWTGGETLAPQREEGIEQAAWMTPTQAQEALQGSYASIRFVLDQYEERQQHGS